MIRWIVALIGIAALALVASWLADVPGDVSLEWYNYRIDTSAAVLAVATVLLITLSALAYRLWWSLWRLSSIVGQLSGERRRRRGYEAVSRGLVAIAAGDPELAGRQARRAQSLLDDGPLSMLLSAQAAQLKGDDQAAARFFEEMRDNPQTEFLGVRGLLTQALKRGDRAEALGLAKRAFALNPKSEWVVGTLLQLQQQEKQWADAERTLEQSIRLKLIPPSEAPRRRAELNHQLSLATSGDNALQWARQAFKADPTYAEGAARLARLWLERGKSGRATAVIREAWAKAPAAELAEVYYAAHEAAEPARRVVVAQELARANPSHPQSRMAVAAAAIEAKLWREARDQLAPLATPTAPPEVCTLMAALEEGEHGDLTAARTWLLRATGKMPGAAEEAT